MINTKKKSIGITLGDPFGVGSEIVAKSMNFLNKKKIPLKFKLIGNKKAFLRSCKICKINPELENIEEFIDLGSKIKSFSNNASKIGGEISYNAICTGAELYKKKKIEAIVTAPISKEALHLAGYYYDGHTGLLSHLFEANNPYLMLANKRFSTIHTTCHLPLKDAINQIKKNLVFDVIKKGFYHFKKINKKGPRIGVCGLNPHAGENNILGLEESKEIIPAIIEAKNMGVNVKGPISSDIIFREAVAGKYDLIVAHYHDQGHIPVKLIYFDQSVNVTLGVPFVRTSVDHGTAYDIAFKNKASPLNMLSAIFYAVKMTNLKNF